LLPTFGLRLDADVARFIVRDLKLDHPIGFGQLPGHFFGPLHQFQAGAGKDVPETGVFPLLRVAETIKVKVPDRPHTLRALGFMGLDHGVGGAFDAPLHTCRAQQVAHQGGFAGAQIALQLNAGVLPTGPGRQGSSQGRSKSLGVLLGAPVALPVGGQVRAGVATYNGRVSAGHRQIDPQKLWAQIQDWARELQLSQIAVAPVDLSDAEPGLRAWLEAGFHGQMHYMQAHGMKRARPAELVPGTVSVITARIDYLPQGTRPDWAEDELARHARAGEAVVSLYARGRDYHKVLRQRLQHLAERIAQEIGPFGHRAFTDSAPVLEVELAQRSGLGWRGKHSLLLSREAGSMFFLGELFVDLALPVSVPTTTHCGRCEACMQLCPTQAIVAPYKVDARRCISYLTIEHEGPIDLALRPLIGNRVYGCDDCQLACPWNKFAQTHPLPDWQAREGLAGSDIAHLLAWDEATFLRRTEGSAIRRIGHGRWVRNLALAAGNALASGALSASDAQTLRQALQHWAQHPSEVVREQVQWSLNQASTPSAKLRLPTPSSVDKVTSPATNEPL
jgi:epoxyqueuosine reductase